MGFWAYLAIWVLLAFLLGSIPFGYIIAKLKGVDIRTVGSGNIGGTNAWRVLGWKAGLPVMALDFLKGLGPLLLLGSCIANLPDSYGFADMEAPLKMAAGLAAIMGHTFTPWLKFKGGKGVATGMGVGVVIFNLWLIPVVALFGLILLTTRYVSLSSVLSSILLAAFCLSIPAIRPYWPFALAACLLVIWTHRTNIERLFAGTENRIGRKKPAKDQAAGGGESEEG